MPEQLDIGSRPVPGGYFLRRRSQDPEPFTGADVAAADKATGDKRKALKDAYGHVEDQEDEHLYHATGWGRELWIQALGMPAVLPPPEEQKSVKTAIGAARAKHVRSDMT